MLITLLILLVVLVIIVYIWQTLIAPKVPAPLNWLIPLIFGILVIVYLLGVLGVLPGLKL